MEEQLGFANEGRPRGWQPLFQGDPGRKRPSSGEHEPVLLELQS